jgi:hypothetical protein
LEREDEVGVYTVAHEEIGHFLKAVDDPEHNRMKLEVKDNPKKIAEIKREQTKKRIAEIEGSDMSERQKKRALRKVTLEVNSNPTPETEKLQAESEAVKKKVENVADDAGEKAVEEFRDLDE